MVTEAACRQAHLPAKEESLYLLCRAPGSPAATSPAMQTLFNEKAHSYSALPFLAGQTYPSSLDLHNGQR